MEEASVCSCCKVLVEVLPRASATHPREDPPAVHEKTAGDEEEEDQGYVLLDQEDHEDEEEEQAEAEQRGQQSEEEIEAAPAEDEFLEVITGGEETAPEDDRVKDLFYWFLWMIVAAVEDESQGEEIVAEDDRLVPEVALDEMTTADNSDAGEGEGDMNHTDVDHDSDDDLDTAVALEEKRMLASSVATAPAMIENCVPHDDEVVREDGTVEMRDFRAEEEDIVVPQGKLFI
jgi:hypothetical protein